MKVLILNGSPRRHGNMSKMLELMKQELEGWSWNSLYRRSTVAGTSLPSVALKSGGFD